MRLGLTQAPATNRELSFSPGKNSGWGQEGDGGFIAQSAAEPSGACRQLRELGVNSLVVALLGPLAALASDSAQKLMLAVVILDIPIEFGTHLFYRDDEALWGALGGLSISATTLALAGLYVAWLVRALAKRTPMLRSGLHINLPLALYLAITMLSVIVAQDKILSLFEVYLLLEACLVYFYVANNVRTRQDALFVVWTLLIGCLLESLIIVVTKFTVTSLTAWDLPIHIHGMLEQGRLYRAGGTVGQPNTTGAYLSIMLASAASVLFTDLGRGHKWLAAGILGIGGVALIFTFSRGGWLALVLALMVLGFVAWRERGLSLKKPVAALALAAVVYLPFHQAVSTRLFADDKGSAESRIPLNRLAFRMIEANPLLGVGANNFTVAMDRYVTSEFRREWLFAVHNKYLLIWTETGAGGLLAYLAFLWGTLRRGWKCWKFGDPLLSAIALGFVAGVAGYMVHQNVDLFRGRPLQQLLCLIAGLLAAMYRISAASQRDNPTPSIA
jgi:putative inorganic carbon (hco3(-)) transporter